jgi:hypothetical protein
MSQTRDHANERGMESDSDNGVQSGRGGKRKGVSRGVSASTPPAIAVRAGRRGARQT